MNIEKLAIEHGYAKPNMAKVEAYIFTLEQLEAFAKALQSSEPVAIAWESKAGTRLNISWLTDTSAELISEGIEAGKVASYLYTFPPSTVPLEEHNKRIAELEATISNLQKGITAQSMQMAHDVCTLESYESKVNALQATNKTLLDALSEILNGWNKGVIDAEESLYRIEAEIKAIADAEGVER